MNNKGFTLVELLATLVILSLVVGLALISFNFNFGKAKEKTEEVFVDTLRDAVDVYLSSEFGNLIVDKECSRTLQKEYDSSVKVVKMIAIKFNDVINSSYKPLVKSEFVNPANEDVVCNINASIDVYRDEDYVYYYSINKSDLGCLKNTDGDYDIVISNLPEGYSCE